MIAWKSYEAQIKEYSAEDVCVEHHIKETQLPFMIGVRDAVFQ